MARASLRTVGDDRRGLERIDDRHKRRTQLTQRVERCEAAVGKTEQMELPHAEPVGSALRFFSACSGELRSRRNVGEIANAFGAVCRDHEMGLSSLSRELRQEWADDAFVVGVSEYCEDEPPSLGLRREWGDRGQRHSEEDMH